MTDFSDPIIGNTASIQHGIEIEAGFIPRFSFDGQVIASGRLSQAMRNTSDTTLDFDALNIFLRTGLFLNGATPFRSATRLSPSPQIVAPVEMSRETAIEGYISLFQQAVRRRLMPGAIVALSGGRDSRHILLELHNQASLPDYALTVQSVDTDDVTVAKQLAEAVNLRHEVREWHISVDSAVQTVLATDFMSLQHAWFFDVSRCRDASAWWDGIGGDVLSAGLFLENWSVKLFETGRLEELATRLVSRGKIPFFRDQGLFRYDAAVSAVLAELSRHSGAANPLGSFYFWNRTRVDIGSSAFGLLRPAGQKTIAPYLDRDLWRFLASVPTRLLVDHNLHDEVIQRAYPSFARIPYASKQSGRKRRHRIMAQRLLSKVVSLPQLKRGDVGVSLRTIRSLLQPRHASEIEWIYPMWVYIHALRGVVGDEAMRT